MRNIIHVNLTDNCNCDLLSNIDTKTNELNLEVICDLSKNPKLKIGSTVTNITANPQQFDLSSDVFGKDGDFSFILYDDSHTGDTFTIHRNSKSADYLLKKISNFEYSLTAKDEPPDYVTNGELSEALKAYVTSVVLNQRLDNMSVGRGRNAIPSIGTDGGLEVGAYIDFHKDADFDAKDYDARLDVFGGVLKLNGQEFQKKIKDTGWITINTFYNGCTHYNNSGGNEVSIRQYGPFVQISGIVKTTKVLGANGSTSNLDLFRIPDAIDPPKMWGTHFLQQGSGSNKFVLAVGYADGRKVGAARYGTTSMIQIPTDAWLNVNCTYMTWWS